MTEALLVIVGILVGGIITYSYMSYKGRTLSELYTDSLVKNRLLKDEIKKSSKPNKVWKKNKKYYGSKKQAVKGK